jgi:hypothetical protein
MGINRYLALFWRYFGAILAPANSQQRLERERSGARVSERSPYRSVACLRAALRQCP